MIRVRCWKCGTKLDFEDADEGQLARCPICRKNVLVQRSQRLGIVLILISLVIYILVGTPLIYRYLQRRAQEKEEYRKAKEDYDWLKQRERDH